MRGVAKLSLGLGFVCCKVGPVGYAHPEAPGVVVIAQQEATRHDLRPIQLVLPFSDGQDGTRLLVAYLDEARRRGASYVSDVAFFIVRDNGGLPVECRTGVYPEEEVVSPMIPGSFRYVPVNRPVRRMVTDWEYRCHMVSRPVSKMLTTYRTSYDSSARSTLSVPETHSVTSYEMQSDCRSEPVTRWVTRYEFEIESQFVPPHLEYVSTQHLKKADPICYSLDGAAASQRANRIEGVAYATPPR